MVVAGPGFQSQAPGLVDLPHAAPLGFGLDPVTELVPVTATDPMPEAATVVRRGGAVTKGGESTKKRGNIPKWE